MMAMTIYLWGAIITGFLLAIYLPEDEPDRPRMIMALTLIWPVVVAIIIQTIIEIGLKKKPKKAK